MSLTSCCGAYQAGHRDMTGALLSSWPFLGMTASTPLMPAVLWSSTLHLKSQRPGWSAQHDHQSCLAIALPIAFSTYTATAQQPQAVRPLIMASVSPKSVMQRTLLAAIEATAINRVKPMTRHRQPATYLLQMAVEERSSCQACMYVHGRRACV